MKVRDIMTKTAFSCRSEMSLAEAGALMWEHDCGLLPLLNDAGKVTGVITDRDVCIAVSTRDRLPSQIQIGEVAKAAAIVCAPDDDIHSAMKTMSKERMRRLPVVNTDGNLVGVVSMNDIVLQAERGDGRRPEISFEEVVRTFQAICAHPAGKTRPVAA